MFPTTSDAYSFRGQPWQKQGCIIRVRSWGDSYFLLYVISSLVKYFGVLPGLQRTDIFFLFSFFSIPPLLTLSSTLQLCPSISLTVSWCPLMLPPQGPRMEMCWSRAIWKFSWTPLHPPNSLLHPAPSRWALYLSEGEDSYVYLCFNLHILKDILTSSFLSVQTLIGLVQLEILRTAEPLMIKATPHQTGTTQLTLKNASSFPLHINLSFNDHCRAFSISPPNLTMTPGTRTSLSVSFAPGASLGTLNRYGGYSRMVAMYSLTSHHNWDHDQLKCVVGFTP